MRWAEPRGPGTTPREKNSVASHTDSATPASTSDVSTCCPSPVRSRAWSAARMPQTAKSPAPRSVSGTPTFTGGRPGSPVTDISPDTPWATRSNPPLPAAGPVWP